MLPIQAIIDAANRLRGHIHQTQVAESALLNRWLGHRILFKMENQQRVGAFKARGALNTLAWLRESGGTLPHIVAYSSGNHAQAVSWAASKLGFKATIFTPQDTSRVKASATRGYGAEVVFCQSRREAEQRAAEMAARPDHLLLPPYDHDQVIAGQGTACYEALQQTGEVDAVFAPCGGGGLLSGTLVAARSLSPKAKVIGAEPLAANDAVQSLRQGSIVRLAQSPMTLADGAATLAVSERTFGYLRQLDDLLEVDEEPMVYWTQWLQHLLKSQIEPTSAMAMAAAHDWLKGQQGPITLLVIISGGNIAPASMARIWQEDHLATPPGEL